MAYTATWVNRLDRSDGKVEIDLNLSDATRFYRQSFVFDASSVNGSFLSNVAANVASRVSAEDTQRTNKENFISANSDLSLIQANSADILTLISRNNLSFNATQMKAFGAKIIAAANVDALAKIAEKVYG